MSICSIQRFDSSTKCTQSQFYHVGPKLQKRFKPWDRLYKNIVSGEFNQSEQHIQSYCNCYRVLRLSTDLAQNKLVGLQEFFIPGLYSQEENYFFQFTIQSPPDILINATHVNKVRINIIMARFVLYAIPKKNSTVIN